MSLYVNPNGKIVMATNSKPIDCVRCPCENIIGDSNVYCVTKEFYSGDNCTGDVQTTLLHQCMCMDQNCSGTWDQEAVCQDRVKYIYENGPYALSCPDNCTAASSDCTPASCTDCAGAKTFSISVTPDVSCGSCGTNVGSYVYVGSCGVNYPTGRCINGITLECTPSKTWRIVLSWLTDSEGNCISNNAFLSKTIATQSCNGIYTGTDSFGHTWTVIVS